MAYNGDTLGENRYAAIVGDFNTFLNEKQWRIFQLDVHK